MDPIVPAEDHEKRAVESATADGVKELCRWASDVEFDDLPEPVRRRAALVVSDNLAAVIAARDEPEIGPLHEQLLSTGATPEATIFRGARPRTDRYSAAVANGAAADWCELDEGYRKAPCHGGLCVLPALWAETEAEERTVRELLRALVIGYEVVTRFARGVPFAEMMLHPHATLPAIGAAAAIAAVRRLPPETFLGAVTGASTMIAPGPFNHAVKGALVRNVWAGIGAWVGLRAVDWAGIGIAGMASSPYDVFVGGLGTDVEPDELTVDLGQSWGIADGYHKIYACCQYSHSAVESMEALLSRRPDIEAARDVERIIVETHWRGLTLDNPRPVTSLAAKFSLPHIMAATSHLGHAGAEAFSAATLDDPSIAALRERVELRRYEPERPSPEDRPARVTWILRTGERLEAECRSARGGPDRPFTPSEILDKVRKITSPVYPRLADICQDLSELDGDTLDMTWTKVVDRMTAGSNS
jgi:2-methylcitrate dehydratase PrpD